MNYIIGYKLDTLLDRESQYNKCLYTKSLAVVGM